MTRFHDPLVPRLKGVRTTLRWSFIALLCLVGIEGALAAIALPAARVIRPTRWSTPVDDVIEFERSILPARAFLSRVREAGYASEVPNRLLMTIGYADQTRRYFLAQYTLAPTVLARAGRQHWLFADFQSEDAMRQYAATERCVIRWNAGGRAVLERTP